MCLVAACGQTEEGPVRAAAPRPAKLVIVGAASAVEARRFPAVVDAAQSTDLSFQVGGQIEELPVSESQQVSEGDIVARLDQQNFQNEAVSARAQFENAEEEYQRAVRLAAEDAIARNIVEQRQAQRDVARATLDSVEKALADSVLRAPFSGVVASVPASRLDTVQPGQVIATLISADGLDATIDIPAALIAQAPTQANTDAFVYLDAAPNVRIEAEFSEANLVADATSQTYAVTFTFAPPDGLLILPGMSATVELATSRNDNGQDRVAVPLAAVASDGAGQYVWVVDNESMMISRRDIEVAPGIGESLVVSDGLQTGETIVGAGVTLLSEGMQVRAWTE